MSEEQVIAITPGLEQEQATDLQESSPSPEGSSADELFSSLSDDEIEKLSDDDLRHFIETGELKGKVEVTDNGSERIDVPSPALAGQQDSDSRGTGSVGSGENRPKSRSGESDGKQGSEGLDDDSAQSNHPVNVNYEEVYKSIFTPFKANGKEVTPRSVDDVISLMQMGANYHKKMATIAPMRKVVESLNQAGIKEEDLNFLIDIHKGNAEAIKTLLQKNKIEPIELDMQSIGYKPENNILSDDDVAFLETVDEIKPSLAKIEEITGNLWDKQSKDHLLRNREDLYRLHEEIQIGRFDAVQKQVETERMFGKHKGKSDLEAYRETVQRMVAEHMKGQQTSSAPASSPAPKPENTTHKPVTSNKGKAAPTRSSPGTATRGKFTADELFRLTDEEFSKIRLEDIL